MTTTDETTGQASEDWWDRLYAVAETTEPTPAPEPVAAPVRPGRLRDWWQKPDGTELDAADDDQDDDIAAVEAEPTAGPAGDNPQLSPEDEAEEEGRERGPWFKPHPGYWPQVVPPLPPKPALSEGTKRLIYNGGAAGTGYWCGLTPKILAAIESCGRSTSISGALVLGGAIVIGTAAIWDRRTRHWVVGLHWFARIPLASAITALALYAPASQL